MITFTKGNLFNKPTEALVNPVNTVGVMGKGLALQFKNKFPSIIPIYKTLCNNDTLIVGEVWPYRISWKDNPLFIMFFPTKQHWKNKSKLEWIDEGLKSLHTEIVENNIKSISIPPLGCGLGGLNWEDVKLLIVKHLKDLPNTNVVVFKP